MEDKEKNQKTVVAFIAGLLIGGLLVWVFTMAPKEDADEGKDVVGTSTDEKSGVTVKPTDKKADSVVVAKPAVKAPEAVTVASGTGSITVPDQTAGFKVVLGNFKMPVDGGWIAIRDVSADGSIGNALGAARFSLSDGLIPSSVELLRATVAGKTYRAIVYKENGDKRLNFATDKVVTSEGGAWLEDSFTATK